MKLKTFFGPTMPALMNTIRSELGEDVLIISTQRLPDGTLKIITAIETDGDIPPTQSVQQNLKEILQKQHIPTNTVTHMLAQTQTDVLLSFVQQTFQFHALTANRATTRAYCLVGPHGSGKTTAVIKLALAAKLSNLNPCILTTDVVKAGAREQLIAFCKIAQIPFIPLTQPADLNNTLKTVREQHQFILIDTMGISYLSEQEMSFLKQLKQSTHGMEMLLTLPAGLDAAESADIAAAFADIGANRLIATKLDTSKYMGNILNAAFQTNMPFAAFGNNDTVTEAFEAPAPQKLAVLLGGTA